LLGPADGNKIWCGVQRQLEIQGYSFAITVVKGFSVPGAFYFLPEARSLRLNGFCDTVRLHLERHQIREKPCRITTNHLTLPPFLASLLVLE
jgi:hypothetical protein